MKKNQLWLLWQRLLSGSLSGSRRSADSVHRLRVNDHFLAADGLLTVHTLWVEDHFLAAVALARFNLSTSRRSEAEHLDRTAPISESFLRSMAASAAPSRSLTGREEEESADDVTGDITGDVTESYLMARWALTLCSGVTLVTYFLASYLLLLFMQTSTNACRWIMGNVVLTSNDRLTRLRGRSFFLPGSQ